MPDNRPVIVLHGGTGSSLRVATRLAGDLAGEGVGTVLQRAEPATLGRLAGCRAAVVVHGSRARWPDEVLGALTSLRAGGTPVLVCSADDSRRPSELEGFGYLSLVPGKSYPPTAAEEVGYRLLLDLAGRRRRRRGPGAAVFLSYSRADAPFVDGLVELLQADGLTTFDYQFTERLVVADLGAELARWVEHSGLVLVVATAGWASSAACAHEYEHARRVGKPVVAVWPPGVGPRRGVAPGAGVPVVSFGRDCAASGRRLVAQLRRHLPYPDD